MMEPQRMERNHDAGSINCKLLTKVMQSMATALSYMPGVTVMIMLLSCELTYHVFFQFWPPLTMRP
jgi:hypothetical protein